MVDRTAPGAHTLSMKPALYRVVLLGVVLAAVPVHAQNLEVKPREEVTLKHRFQ